MGWKAKWLWQWRSSEISVFSKKMKTNWKNTWEHISTRDATNTRSNTLHSVSRNKPLINQVYVSYYLHFIPYAIRFLRNSHGISFVFMINIFSYIKISFLSTFQHRLRHFHAKTLGCSSTHTHTTIKVQENGSIKLSFLSLKILVVNYLFQKKKNTYSNILRGSKVNYYRNELKELF